MLTIMPQITLEYTSNLKTGFDFKSMFHEIHHILNTVAGINIGNCKSRAVRLDEYYIAEGKTNNGFVHLDVRILSGRKFEIKEQLGREILQILEQYFAGELKSFDLQITVEIRDIERKLYFKKQSENLL